MSELKPVENPSGTWKKGLCECCDYPNACGNICNTICCTTCVVAQTVGRVKSFPSPFKDFQSLLRGLIGLLVFNVILSLCRALGTTPAIQKDPQDAAAVVIDAILGVISLLIALYFLYIIVKMRYDVAAANGIKTSAADCLIAWCCSCCSIIQVANEAGVPSTDCINMKDPDNEDASTGMDKV